MKTEALHTAMQASQKFTRWASYQLDRQDREEQVRKAAAELEDALAKWREEESR